jgi:hypothetical protein
MTGRMIALKHEEGIEPRNTLNTRNEEKGGFKKYRKLPVLDQPSTINPKSHGFMLNQNFRVFRMFRGLTI